MFTKKKKKGRMYAYSDDVAGLIIIKRIPE